ncbi:MAG: phosphopyruvate hydratase [Candidatus Woesearchaeota archaeon]|jgi:enolase
MKIEKIHARQILDSRGNPTIEVDVHTDNATGTAAVPSGASTGKYEAIELRDKKTDYQGKSVYGAVHNVCHIISPLLIGVNVDDQRKIDNMMIQKDGTKNKGNLGANAILGVSMACSRAGAISYNMHLHEYLGSLYDNKEFTLPIPFCNVINGGVHAGNGLKFQEFMIVPYKAKTFAEATKMVCETYHELKKVISESFGTQFTSLGDEGGFAPIIDSPEAALDLMEVALGRSGHKSKIAFAMDVAASEFYDEKTKKYQVSSNTFFTTEELVEYYVSLTKKYNIISIEDPFDQDDFEGYTSLMSKIGAKVQIVGDDLLVTNVERIKKAIELKACNALLLKVNQIGSLTEAFEAAKLAQSNGWKVMVSHRSGETEDAFIADLAVAISAGMIKLGAPARGERTAKYNELLRIEDAFADKIKYAKF